MREIPLTCGMVALVDDEDYDEISKLKWYPFRVQSHRIYAQSARGVKMHRMIMKPAPGLVVDHINFNTLDNRRSNLRSVTTTENVMHRRPIPVNPVEVSVTGKKIVLEKVL